jgi:hypothetical protein
MSVAATYTQTRKLAVYTEWRPGALAQLGERRLCKPEVTGSIPVRSNRKALETGPFFLSTS